MKRLTSNILVGLLVLAPTLADACTMCFYGDPDEPANRSLRAGVLVLLLIVLGMLALFARFFLKLKKRSQNMTREMSYEL